MAEEPHDFVATTLREIQRTLGEHTRRFDNIESEIGDMKRSVDALHETVYLATGFATHAHTSAQSVHSRVDELEKRLAKLEEKA